MADLLAILSQAGSSLGAHRSASAVASHNIQNVNTPGYSRQSAELTAMLPAEYQTGAFIGRGVTLGTVTQARDRFVEQQMSPAMASQSRSSAESDSLGAVSALDPDASASLSAAMGDFFSSLRAMAQNPSDPGLRTAAVGAAQTFSMNINRTATAIESARTGLDSQIAANVGAVNNAAAAMADLNQRVAVARAEGAEPNDLLDARQKAQDTLSQLTGAQPVPDASGDITMMLPNGGALVSGNRAAVLGTQPDPANGGHLMFTLTRPDGSPPVALAASALGGTLGGAVDARDGALASAGTALDQMAFDFAGAVNTAHAAGYALDGSTGRNLFVVGPTAQGAAASISVNAAIVGNPSLLGAAASAAAAPGDSGALYNVIAAENQTLSSGSTAAGTLQNITASFGAASDRAKAMSEQDGAILDQLTTMRESVSGVSLDDEMINLTKAQRAFDAVSKIITTTDQMLTTLLALRP